MAGAVSDPRSATRSTLYGRPALSSPKSTRPCRAPGAIPWSTYRISIFSARAIRRCRCTKAQPLTRPVRAIADNIIELLPDQPVIQIGIGKIPESLVHELAQRGVGGLRFTGMGCDAMVDLAEAGLLQLGEADQHAITSPDLLGTPRLMQFADDNPSVGLYPSSFSHSPVSLSAHERLVSINSAVEVDLTGQVNAETVKGRRVSGVGGSLDFSEGATHSLEGLRIVALPASRIVEQLGSGSVVTTPRSAVDMVVTERGVARLEGLTERERASALTGIAGDALTQIP